MKRAAALLVLLAACHGARPLVVGSKKFTESVLLGELATRLCVDGGVPARHEAQLGGTRVLWDALVAGRVDVYPEYTGTLCQEILRSPCDRDAIARALAAHHVVMTPSLGFSDGYALAVRAGLAARLHLSRISDLTAHPELRFGFTAEFLARGDGWPALRAHYGLPQTDVRGIDHDLAWRGLESGTLDVIDAYGTDAEIRRYQPVLLADDRGFFTAYDAVLVYRDTLPEPARRALSRLVGAISAEQMIAMNARAELDKTPEPRIAADFLRARFGVVAPDGVAPDGVARRVWQRTVEHLTLVGLSVGGAILLGLPLGIVAARRRRLRQLILGTTGLMQTIPSLALLVFMIPLFGIGTGPALVALVLYSLLPIVRNTVAGIDAIAAPLRESAAALGLTPWERLRLVELPLAMPSILAGVQTAAVIAVGTATLGALIGAGGYGQPILTGIRLDDTPLILEGALPAALLALAVQLGFDGLERLVVSRGLRVRPAVDE